MSTNIDLIKKFYNSFKAHDGKYLQMCTDDIEWIIMKSAPNGGTHIGKKAIFEEYFPDLFSKFIEFHAIPDEFLDAGDKVVVLGKYQMTSKKLKKKFESSFSHVYTIKNGKIAKFVQYADTKQILDATIN